jgi:hypothetical protein
MTTSPYYPPDEVPQQIDTATAGRENVTRHVRDDDTSPIEGNDIDMRGLVMLSILRFSSLVSVCLWSLELCMSCWPGDSSAWGERSSNFAFYLFLVTIFPSTLLPASVYGFCVTGSGILFSGSVGSLIDKHNRLNVIRSATLGQKISSGVMYALFLLYFLAPLAHNGRMNGRSLAAFVGVVLCGAILKVSTVCLTISLERDWASTIGRGSSRRLTKLNAWIRRIVRAPFHTYFGVSHYYSILGSHVWSHLPAIRVWPHGRRKLSFRCGVSSWHDSAVVVCGSAINVLYPCNPYDLL